MTMERFPDLTTCPACRVASPYTCASAAGFTQCAPCGHVYKLTDKTLEELARVALLNMATSTAVRVLTEARDVLLMSGAGPATVAALAFPAPVCPRCKGPAPCLDCARAECAAAARVEPVGAMGEAMLAETLTPELRTMRAVCDRLRAEGLDASIEYPGFIHVTEHAADGDVWGIGTTNGTWGGSVQTADGAPGVYFETTEPGESTDADAIARAVLAALRDYCRACGENIPEDDPRPEPLCGDCWRTEKAARRSRGER
jgi:hypothetical protein